MLASFYMLLATICKYIPFWILVLTDYYNSLHIQAHMALNDIDSAVESFKKALDLEPNDGNSL